MKEVEIILEPGTRVPLWIRVQNLRVEIRNLKEGGKRVKSLLIRGGEAHFIPGGAIGVIVPGSSESRQAFDDKTVREIFFRNGDGNGEHIRNHRLCPKCGALVGERVVTEPASTPGGRATTVMQCLDCSESWPVP